MSDFREASAKQIHDAYLSAEKELRKVGRLLRTTEAGKYVWATEHKTAVSGLAICINKLAYDVPDYNQWRGVLDSQWRE